MSPAATLLGFFALLSACVAFFPLLNALNYCLTLPLGILGLVLSLTTLARPRDGGFLAMTGLFLSLTALFIAGIRIVLSFLFGGGLF